MEPTLAREALGEFAGTTVLVLLGVAANASFTLPATKSGNAGWLATTAAWAFAVFCGAVTAVACGSPSADLNPAVTLAAAVHTGVYRTLLPFALAQCAGGLFGATLAWLFYFQHWGLSHGPDREARLSIFCTTPAIRNLGWNFFSEFLGTSVLLLVIAAIGSRVFAAAGPAPGLSPYLVAIVVWSVGLSLGATTGYAINPARDLGPRLAHALLPVAGKGSSDWGYAIVPIAGPLAGALVIGLLLRWLGI